MYKKLLLLTIICSLFIGFTACDKQAGEEPKDTDTTKVKEEAKDQPKEEAKEEKGCLSEAGVKTMPALHLVGKLSEEGYEPEVMEKTWQEATDWAEKNNIFGPETQGIGIYYDMPGNPKAKMFAGYTCAPDLKPSDGMTIADLPEGEYFFAKFAGKKDEIEKAYTKIYSEMLAKEGLVPGMPMYEIWMEKPDKDNPDFIYKFDICIPVTKMEAKAEAKEEPAKKEEKAE